MESILRILAFVVGGGILAYLTLLYVSALYSALYPGRDARQIAPIQTIAEGKASTDLGAALAQMLLVHLGEIKQKLDEASHALRPGATVAPPRTVGPVERHPVTLLQDELPNRLQESLTVQLNVGGVELSGIANWLFRQFSSPATMKIVIESVGTNRHVYGNFDPAATETFVIRMGKGESHDVILDAIAHRIAQRSISRSIPQIEALRDDEFKNLMNALSQLADLNREIARGRAPAKDFDAVLTLLDPLTKTVPNWSALTRISGEVAERANNLPRAKELYEQAVAHAEEKAEREDLEKRIARISTTIAEASARLKVPSAEIVPTAAPPLTLLQPLLEKLGLKDTEMRKPVRMAIVGGAPEDGAVGRRIKLVGPKSTEPGDAVSDYFVGIMNTVAFIAPNTDFIFSRRSVARLSDILLAIEEVLPEKPQIILLPIRGFGPPVDRVLLHAAGQNIVVVLPAGNAGPNEAVAFTGSELLDKVVVVSAVQEDGMPAAFSQRDTTSLWAPGTGLPVSGMNDTTQWDGTGPASALAAGVIARVLAEKPDLKLPELLVKLREGSAPLSQEAGAPRVINAARTLDLATP